MVVAAEKELDNPIDFIPALLGSSGTGLSVADAFSSGIAECKFKIITLCMNDHIDGGGDI